MPTVRQTHVEKVSLSLVVHITCYFIVYH
jgi:hypothetical protein